MKKFLLLCLNMFLVASIGAARPVLTKEKWQQMKQGGLQEESIVPETRPMLVEDGQDDESDQTPPPLPPRSNQVSQVTPPPLPPRPVTPPPLPPRPVAKQSTKEEFVQTEKTPGLPFTDQDLAAQAGKLKKPTNVQTSNKE